MYVQIYLCVFVCLCVRVCVCAACRHQHDKDTHTGPVGAASRPIRGSGHHPPVSGEVEGTCMLYEEEDAYMSYDELSLNVGIIHRIMRVT